MQKNAGHPRTNGLAQRFLPSLCAEEIAQSTDVRYDCMELTGIQEL
jgi:hypothetical protein